ncbi:MAG: hypothetical protein CFH16_00939, partial [Alphaproteobacteria bacterium MarineAlpha5_Bin6]
PPYSVIVGNPARISKNRKTSMDKNDLKKEFIDL